ncbi:MAG: hypothetical protein DHS20C21_16290 [Gemmatimonadota bacterium]|nr:MAG: hypothetical protein DHS20C21_16290 [Gemmatimonadota bacterium]
MIAVPAHALAEQAGRHADAGQSGNRHETSRKGGVGGIGQAIADPMGHPRQQSRRNRRRPQAQGFPTPVLAPPRRLPRLRPGPDPRPTPFAPVPLPGRESGLSPPNGHPFRPPAAFSAELADSPDMVQSALNLAGDFAVS